MHKVTRYYFEIFSIDILPFVPHFLPKIKMTCFTSKRIQIYHCLDSCETRYVSYVATPQLMNTYLPIRFSPLHGFCSGLPI